MKMIVTSYLFYYCNKLLLLTIPLHSFITIVVMECVCLFMTDRSLLIIYRHVFELFIFKYYLWVVFSLLYFNSIVL